MGKKKDSRRDHAFKPDDVLVCLSDFKQERHDWPQLVYPDKGETLVVLDSGHYPAASIMAHKKGVRLLHFYVSMPPLCSYNFRRATAEEMMDLTAKREDPLIIAMVESFQETLNAKGAALIVDGIYGYHTEAYARKYGYRLFNLSGGIYGR